jgi:hypothetical protein
VAILNLVTRWRLLWYKKVFVVKTLYSFGRSCVVAERQHRREFSVCVAPPTDTIYRKIKRFEERGNVWRKRRKGSSCFRTEVAVAAAQKAINRSPRKVCEVQHNSFRSQPALHGKCVVMTCRRYRTKCSCQPLLEEGTARRHAFARKHGALLEDIPRVLNVMWFYDEAQFHVDGYINEKNIRFWASQNPRLADANPQHPERVRAWCSLPRVWIFSPVFIYDTATSDVFLSVLSDEFIPFLMGYGIPLNWIWVQQNGASAHTCVMPYFAFFMICSSRHSCRSCILCHLRKDFRCHLTHWT